MDKLYLLPGAVIPIEEFKKYSYVDSRANEPMFYWLGKEFSREEVRIMNPDMREAFLKDHRTLFADRLSSSKRTICRWCGAPKEFEVCEYCGG